MDDLREIPGIFEGHENIINEYAEELGMYEGILELLDKYCEENGLNCDKVTVEDIIKFSEK
jgi:hypothetical protein